MAAVIGEALKYLLRKGFDIREGEYMRASLMQLNIFLIISTLLIVKPTVNALFLSEIGAKSLPEVFVMVAVFAALVSTLYSRLLSRVSLDKIMIGTLLVSVLILIGFGILLRINAVGGWILYLFYIWVALFALLATSQFWILANLVFNPREAKRLFGFIGAGAIAGGIFGGYLTSVLAPLMGSENLLFVCAFLLHLTIPITRWVWKGHVASHQTGFQQQKQANTLPENPIRIILKSRHLTFLAAIIGVSVIVAKLVEYQFSDVASARIEDPDSLAAFFGFWLSTMNLLSLLVQLFITRRVVGVFGVGYSLFFLPGGIAIGALLLMAFPVLWAAVLIKIADGSLKQSINKAATELLALPIPVEVKNQAKMFIDVFVDSAATGIGGLILIFIVSGLDLSTPFISLIILGLIGVWVYFAIQVRKEYIHSFKIRITPHPEAPQTNPLDISRDSVKGGLIRVLKEGDEPQILFVLRHIREFPDERFFEPIHALLRHPSVQVQTEAVRNLYFYRNHILREEIEPLIKHPEQQLKIVAFEYLIKHVPENTVLWLRAYLQDPDYRVSCAALVSLALDTRSNPTLKDIFQLELRIQEKLEGLEQISDTGQLAFIKIHVIKTITHAHIHRFYLTIVNFMEDDDPEVVRQAITSAGKTLDSYFIPFLLRFLGEGSYRNFAQEALSGYGAGIIPLLYEFTQEPDADLETVRGIAPVVQNIDSQRSVDFLFSLLDYADLAVHIEALKALNQLRVQFPHLTFSQKGILRRILGEVKLYRDTLAALHAQLAHDPKNLQSPKLPAHNPWEARHSLILLLERRLDGNLERIFQLLGLKYPPEDIHNIYRSIQSKKPDMRANAIEFLDNLLEPNLKKVLVPVVETAMLDTISEEAFKKLNLELPTEQQCFTMLLQGKDTKIKLAVLYLLAQLKDPRYLELVRRYSDHANPKVRDFAADALKAIRSAK